MLSGSGWTSRASFVVSIYLWSPGTWGANLNLGCAQGGEVDNPLDREIEDV